MALNQYFFDYYKSQIKMEKDERYIVLYDKLIYHSMAQMGVL